MLNGRGPADQAPGALYLAGSVGESCAAWGYWTTRGRPKGRSDVWRQVATLIGVAGLVGFGLLLLYAFVVVMAWLSNLS